MGLMRPQDYREQARRVLESGRYRELLGARAGLAWRTHDHGLLVFDGGRLSEACRRDLALLLGGEGQAGARRGTRLRPERCALPLDALYARLAGLACATDPEADGGLPGGGCLVLRGMACYGLSASPEAFLDELLRWESQGRERLLGRLLGTPGHTAAAPAEPGAQPAGASCGSCGNLLGTGQCLGGACSRHGA
jgi:hypothetical protein